MAITELRTASIALAGIDAVVTSPDTLVIVDDLGDRRQRGLERAPLPYDGGNWLGKMKGNVQGAKVRWKLVFQLSPVGGLCVGDGYIEGSATLDALAFTIRADGASMLIDVLDPLPSGNHMNFALTDLIVPARDRLEASFQLFCMSPIT